MDMKTTAATQQQGLKQQEFERLFSEHFAITPSGQEALAKALAFRQEAEVRARRPRFA
jgi:hypothetical protein